MTEKRDFIGYEYKDVLIDKSMETVYLDSFPYFGWIFEKSETTFYKGQHLIEMKFKRDRKITNKAELTRLQKQFEAYVQEIILLNNSKTTKASIVAFTIGILGTVFIAGATFSYLAQHIILMVILAIPGFLGWIAPYFCYQKIYAKRVKMIVPLVEEKYDEIYTLCEKGNRLLGNDMT